MLVKSMVPGQGSCHNRESQFYMRIYMANFQIWVMMTQVSDVANKPLIFIL